MRLFRHPTFLCAEASAFEPSVIKRLLERAIHPRRCNSGYWDKAIADARNGGDESRTSTVILQFEAQRADVPVHDVACGDEIGSPKRFQNLYAAD